MKKIKRKAQKTAGAKKEFGQFEFFYSYKRRIVNILGLCIIIILGTTLLWLWFRNREIEAGFSFSRAKSIGDYEQIVSGFSFTKTKPLAMVVLAQRLFDEEKYVEAISLYKEFIKQYPKHKLVPAASIGLAYCYEEISDFEKAEAVFIRIQKEFSNNIWAKEAKDGYKRVSQKRHRKFLT